MVSRETLIDILKDLTKEPLNQDERGGCVFCGGSEKGWKKNPVIFYCTEHPDDHTKNCPYIIARNILEKIENE